MKNYFNKSDERLVALFLKKKNKNAEYELIRRFTIFSVGLARSLLHQFRKHCFAEIEDLTNIGLLAMYTSFKNYKFGKNTFKAYWRKIARNAMMELIKESSPYYQSNKTVIICNNPYGETNSLAKITMQEDSEYIANEIASIFDQNHYRFKKNDKELFMDSLRGFNSSEISKRHHMSFTKVKRRIAKIKQILAHIVLKS